MVKELMLELGFKNQDIEVVLSNYSLQSFLPETLAKRIKENFEYLLSLGYKEEEIIKISKRTPGIYSHPKEGINKRIDNLIELGYTKEEIIKMTKNLPQLYNLNMDNIKRKIEDVITLGYTKEEVLRMSVILPAIYSYNIENIRQKHKGIIDLGFTNDEVISMTKKLPAMYSFNTDSIKEKVEFYDMIGLHNMIIEKTKNLVQSVELSYARYMFFIEKGHIIDKDNYIKLFIREKQLMKTFGVTNKELLDKYRYKEYAVKKLIKDN